MSATLPSGQLSNVPWRRTGVKYNNNEAYFDVIEEIDAIIDKSGAIVSAEIQGYVSSTLLLIPTYLMHSLLNYYLLKLTDRLLHKAIGNA